MDHEQNEPRKYLRNKMLDGDQPKSEEERIEEIKFEIKRLFNALEPEVIDPELKAKHDQQRERIIELANKIDKTSELPIEAKNELYKYFELLEVIEANQCHSYDEYEGTQIKIAIAHSKMYYEFGKIDIALKLLYDPENPDGGAEYQAKNIAERTEENEQIFHKIHRLTDLVYDLSNLSKE